MASVLVIRFTMRWSVRALASAILNCYDPHGHTELA